MGIRGKDYFVNEGNKIGYVETSWDSDINPSTLKITAAADLDKGNVVEITSAGAGETRVNKAGADSAKVIGVAMFDYTAGSEVAIETEGLFKLTASGTITAGAKVIAGAAGTVSTLGSGVNPIGIAISSATSGNPVYVKFTL
jgi:predicted RecA/RadA family phage recombinase